MGMMDDLLNDGFNAIFFDSDLCPGVEEIVITPDGGMPKTINANVSRQGVTPNFQGGKTQGQGVQIWIKNHATHGLNAINAGKLTVTMKLRLDQPAQKCRISKVWDDSDGGTWHLSIQE